MIIPCTKDGRKLDTYCIRSKDLLLDISTEKKELPPYFLFYKHLTSVFRYIKNKNRDGTTYYLMQKVEKKLQIIFVEISSSRSLERSDEQTAER
jgi:hypothetical protein